MEERRRRIAEDLADSLDGELRTDRTALSLYATDASLFEIEPLAVALPRNASDVVRLAAYSADQGIPLIARGAGSGLAGGAIGRGIVIDFSRYMNQILSIDRDRVRVQPGVTRDQLNAALRPHGRYFAPDPSNSRITTVGGMLAVDAAGAHAIRVGSTRDHVVSIECVVSGGQRFEAGVESVGSVDPTVPRMVSLGSSPAETAFSSPGAALAAHTAATRKTAIVEGLSELLDTSRTLIRQHQPPLLRNSSGYLLRGILSGTRLDLARLLVGSEGTLALFTEATLYTMAIPEHRSAALLLFGSLDQAISATQRILPMDPSACDLLDRRLLSLGRQADSRFRDMISPEAEAGLVVEFTAVSARDAMLRLQDLQLLLRSEQIDFRCSRTAVDYDDVELLWRLPAQIVSVLASLRGDSRPLPFVEDVAVPPDQLAEFLVRAQRVFQKHEVTATLYAHAASGQLHFRPILPVPSRGDATLLMNIATDLYSEVARVQGTISGEHGDGISRTPWISRQYGPLVSVFRNVKKLLDPLNLMNPDKIITSDPQPLTAFLRETRLHQAAPESVPTLLPVMQFAWQPQAAADAAVRCNGCGSCRVPLPTERMCPFVDQSPSEDFTPRAKANLLRRALCADAPTDLLQSESIKPVIESCFNCRQCEIDCPSEVNIPHIVLEARAQFVRAHGLTRTQWLLSRVHSWGKLASRFAWLVNPLLRYRATRQLLQRFTGIAAERRLPAFATRPFMETLRVRREDNSGAPGSSRPTVVYFVDYFANHHDPELAEAFVRVLEHNGFRVYIPREQTISGMNMVSAADLPSAREVALKNLRELIEPARERYPILCTEPSAALCLTREYPALIGSEEAQVVAAQAQDAGSFLLDLHRRGLLKKDFTPLPMKVAWHTPCHIRALSREAAMPQLLRLIPQLEITEFEKGCTGMAGTFGLAAENFSTSLRIGSDVIRTMQTIDAVAGTTDCSACRMQMEQQATIPTIHPIKLLAFAYGLMPRLEQRFRNQPAGLSLS
ncbi:MAG: Anaerobic glycerol-3-phosphate dehydrogenase subunit [Planctomycetota bacterium]